ncbi:MAG TPA: hypothetical protein VKV38_05215 [Trebonia sp.]|nr:hypothetical protein [Trebonia sp.]
MKTTRATTIGEVTAAHFPAPRQPAAPRAPRHVPPGRPAVRGATSAAVAGDGG